MCVCVCVCVCKVCSNDASQNMGFDEVKAEEALSRYGSVQSAVDALLAGKGLYQHVVLAS